MTMSAAVRQPSRSSRSRVYNAAISSGWRFAAASIFSVPPSKTFRRNCKHQLTFLKQNSNNTGTLAGYYPNVKALFAFCSFKKLTRTACSDHAGQSGFYGGTRFFFSRRRPVLPFRGVALINRRDYVCRAFGEKSTNATATSFTFVPVGPVRIRPFTAFRAW